MLPLLYLPISCTFSQCVPREANWCDRKVANAYCCMKFSFLFVCFDFVFCFTSLSSPVFINICFYPPRAICPRPEEETVSLLVGTVRTEWAEIDTHASTRAVCLRRGIYMTSNTMLGSEGQALLVPY